MQSLLLKCRESPAIKDGAFLGIVERVFSVEKIPGPVFFGGNMVPCDYGRVYYIAVF